MKRYMMVLWCMTWGLIPLYAVSTTTVQKKSVPVTLERYGTIVADQRNIVQITPRFSGYVVELFADTLYKKVKKGEMLAHVYSPDVLQAKEEYLNSLNYQTVHDNGSILASAQSKLELLGISHQEIKSLKETKKATPYTTIYAPIDGYIFEKHIEKGAAFGAKEMLFHIVNIDTVWMEASMTAGEALHIHTYPTFTVFVEGVGEFQAKFMQTYPKLEGSNALLTLRFKVVNTEHKLAIGSFAALKATRLHEALVIPQTARIQKNDAWYVFVVTDFKDVYEPKQVEIRPLNDEYDEIIGIEAGTSIILDALFMLDSDAVMHGLY